MGKFLFRIKVLTSLRRGRIVSVLAVLLLVFCGRIIPVQAQYLGPVSPPAPFITLDTFLGRVAFHVAMIAGGDFAKMLGLVNAQTIQAFYNGRGNDPLWTGSYEQDRARSLLSVLEKSWTHGLPPDAYHVAEIGKLLDDSDPIKRVRLELLLSDAIIRYGRDITGIHIDPKPLDMNPAYWRQPLPEMDILKKVSAASDPAAVLATFAPRGRFYNALQAELVALAREKNDDDAFAPVKFGGGLFKPGQRHADVVKLRARMGLLYDPATGPEERYDKTLVQAVEEFQKQHGLEPDGILGAKTLLLLNRSRKDKMEQVIANMERFRWMDQEKPDRYILVNIPSQMLWAIENGNVAHEMRVVVGMPVRETKSFKTNITGIRFNPSWTVPLKIKVQDFLPKLREDPGFLAEKNISVYRGTGKERVEIDSRSVDWSKIGWRELNQMHMRQKPGGENALGYIRAIMPNEYDIYLHDTNHRDLFVKNERMLSSGCVRLSQPDVLARFVLAGNTDWSGEKMQEILASQKTHEIQAVAPLPVYIQYQSMWLDKRGRLIYGPDVYKQDAKLIAILKGGKDYVFSLDGDTTRLAVAGNGPATTVQ